MTCQDFLSRHSEYVDELLAPAEAARLAAHIRECAACARYDQVVRRGVDLLRAAPEVEPSTDFFPRLQHRLYNLEEDLRGDVRAPGPNAMVSLALAGILALLAWSPLMRFDQVLLPVAGAGENWATSEGESAMTNLTDGVDRAEGNRGSLATMSRVAETGRAVNEFNAPSSLRPMGIRAQSWTPPQLRVDDVMMHRVTTDRFDGAHSGSEPAFTTPWPPVNSEAWRWAGASMGGDFGQPSPDPLLSPPAMRYQPRPLRDSFVTLNSSERQPARPDRDSTTIPD